MAQTIVHRRIEGVTGEEVVKQFRTSLTTKSEQYKMSDIEELVEMYAKNPTDNFIVSDRGDLECQLTQGDIILYHESSDFYQEVITSVTNLRETTNMNLQEGNAVTGDHRIVTLPNTEITIQEGRFTPLDNVTRNRSYECKIIESNKPFLITHKEHGNIAVLEGKYIAYTALDPKTQQRVID